MPSATPRKSPARSRIKAPADTAEPVETGASSKTEASATPRAPRKRAVSRKSAASPQVLLEIVEKSLDDGKAEDIIVIDLIGKSSIADFMVIATGRSQRQVVALAENLRAKLDEIRKKRVSLEGLPQGDWVLVDAGDVIVHIFRPEVRAFYNLEKMWEASLPEGATVETTPSLVPAAGRTLSA